MNVGKNFIKLIQDPEGNFSWENSDIIPLGANRIRIIGEAFDLTPEIQTAFTDTISNFDNNIMDDQSVQNLKKS